MRIARYAFAALIVAGLSAGSAAWATGRYVVFAGEEQYPYGGWGDMRQDFGTLAAAEAYVETEFQSWNRQFKQPEYGNGYWWQIVDLEQGKAVKEEK